MPAGEVSLTLYSDESSISLSPVTYYTRMGEISSFLENASAPMEFMCQVRVETVKEQIISLAYHIANYVLGLLSHKHNHGFSLSSTGIQHHF